MIVVFILLRSTQSKGVREGVSHGPICSLNLSELTIGLVPVSSTTHFALLYLSGRSRGDYKGCLVSTVSLIIVNEPLAFCRVQYRGWYQSPLL